MASPTICGNMVELLAHVLITVFLPERIAASTCFASFSLIAGPFLVDLDIFPLYPPICLCVLHSFYRKPSSDAFYSRGLVFPRVSSARAYLQVNGLRRRRHPGVNQ